MGKKIGKYELGPTLGSGAFSKVKLATDGETGMKWAIKIIDKEQLAREHLEEQLKREIAIMKALNHPHIVHLREVMQTANHIYMVLEVIKGGELFDRIVECKKFDEDTARRYFQQLVGGVRYCHSQGIAHRDIKPENLLLDEHNNLKISDFGLSNLQPTNRAGLLQTVCGTPNYVAPEVLKEKGYDGFKADAWSCGIVLFVMLAGYLPFDDQNQNALFNKIERGDYRMSRHFSEQAKDMISKLIVVDPAKRLSIDQVMQHPWFQKDLDKVQVTGTSRAPTDEEVDKAIRAEKEEDGSPAGSKSPGAAVDKAANFPTESGPVDAFQIISLLTGGLLNPHSAATADVDVSKKTYHFLIAGGQNELSTALQSAGCNVKVAGKEMRGFFNHGSHGLLTFQATCTATAAPYMSIAEIKRGRGDPLEFQNLMKAVFEKLGDKLKSQPAPSASNE
jgi:serine/threonine protein kinase